MRKNLPLIVGIALPILFIIVLFLVVAVPSFFVNPQYNFLYITDSPNGYNTVYKDTYAVSNGSLVLQPVTISVPNYPNTISVQSMPTLYLYDVKTDSSHEISLNDAQALSLDPGPTSPDGYTVDYKYGNSGVFDLFGGGGSEYGYYISKGGSGRVLSAITDSSYGNSGFKLIGWVK